jgi:hypothetical protein
MMFRGASCRSARTCSASSRTCRSACRWRWGCSRDRCCTDRSSPFRADSCTCCNASWFPFASFADHAVVRTSPLSPSGVQVLIEFWRWREVLERIFVMKKSKETLINNRSCQCHSIAFTSSLRLLTSLAAAGSRGAAFMEKL